MIYFLLGAIALFVFNKKDDITETVGESLDFNKYDSLFKKYGSLNGVAWQYLKAICMNESSLGNAKSVAHGLEYPSDIEASKSTDGKSWGLMQITIPTGKDLDPLCSPEKLNNAEYSIKLAAKLVSQLQKKFNSSDKRWLEWVIKSYNQGAGNTNKEKSGVISGYADEYWKRFQRNLERVNSDA